MSGAISSTTPVWVELSVSGPDRPFVSVASILNYTPTGAVQRIYALELIDADALEAATTQAGIATSQAAIATAARAAAQRSEIATASLGKGYLNPGANFAAWDVAGNPPEGWSVWNALGGNSFQRGDVTLSLGHAVYPEGSPWFYRSQVAAGDQTGLVFSANLPTGAGTFLVEATAQLLSGDYGGAGVLVYWFDGAGNYQGEDYLPFASHPDTSGTVSASKTGLRRFSKSFTTPSNTAKIRLYAMSNYSAGMGTMAAKDIAWLKCGLKPAGATEAMVLDQASVLATHDTMLATRVIRTQAGPTSAEVAFHSLASGGGAASQITIRADEVALGDMTKIALKVRGGDALFSGNINAGGGIFVGDRAIPVALQSFPMEVYDGQAVSYGASLGNIPDIVADFSGFAALPAGQSYVFRAEGHTPSGFTARVKTLSSATLATATNTGATTPGTGPTFQMHKADARDAYNGRYTFVVTGSMYRVKQELIEPPETVYQGYVALRFWVRPAGASSWTDCGVKYVGASPGPTGNYTYTSGVQVDFGGTIGLDPTNTEFGVSFEGGWSGTNTLTGLNSVSYQYQVSGSETTATPGNTPLLPIRVMPKNQ